MPRRWWTGGPASTSAWSSTCLPTAIALATTVAAGAFAGYKIATDDELRGRLLRSAQDIVDTSKKKMDVMTEDVAMRTAQVTKNPKINQGWVSKQWENVGY